MKLSAAIASSLVAFAISGASAQAPPSQERPAQEKGREKDIPESSRPPAGMCRIWLDNVPAAQQPAPTDCASAVRNRPAKGRVIFGDDYVKKGKKSDSSKSRVPIKGFAPPRKP
jgi:hypothetical protein